MFLDLNIPWPEVTPLQAYAHLTPILKLCATLGYDVVALNATVTTTKGAKDFLQRFMTIDIFEKLVLENPKLKILKRVTLALSDASPHQNIAQLVEDGWQIIAVCPRTEKQLQSCASALDVDIICIDTTQRLPYVLRHKPVCSAVARGVRFEITYSSAVTGNAKQCIANASMLFRASRNRGIIVSSGVRSCQGLRAPMDIANLVSLWGLKTSAAVNSISSIPEEAATQGILRAKSAKQTIIPMVILDKSSELKLPPSKKLKKQ